MSDLSPTTSASDEQVSLALSRVHGRLRRRRNGLRGAGAATLASVLLIVMGMTAQDQAPEVGTTYGMTGEEGGGLQPDQPASAGTAICGHALAPAQLLGLELTIQGPVEWPDLPVVPGVTRQVSVVARNVGTKKLTISLPPGVVGLSDGGQVDTEPAWPVMMPTTLTLDPSEAVEVPSGLPNRSCTGDAVGAGRHALVPIVTVEDAGHRRVVRGSSLVVHRR